MTAEKLKFIYEIKKTIIPDGLLKKKQINLKQVSDILLFGQTYCYNCPNRLELISVFEPFKTNCEVATPD